LESGDFLYAAYGASTASWPAFASAQDLRQFVNDYSPNLALIEKLKITSFADALKLILNWARALAGETNATLSLSDARFDENDYVETYRGNPFFSTFHAVARVHLCYTFGEYEMAHAAARAARASVYHLSGTLWPVLFDFWQGLTVAANYADVPPDQQAAYLAEMEKAQQLLAALAENCPDNFRCQWLLLSAEIERLRGHELPALALYTRAIEYAEETTAVQYRALANELCARFWLWLGQNKVAAVFLSEARLCYRQWGAAAKVAELERRHSALFRRQEGRGGSSPQGFITASDASAESLDVVSAMRAAQAIASESELEKLLGRLMRIAIENAGAERGNIIFEHDGEAFVQVEGSLDTAGAKLRDAIPLAEAKTLSPRVVNYVRRTLESVVLGDATSDDRYATDEYIRSAQPRSIMCVPMLNQGRLIGAFYLENNLVTDAFTSERMRVVQLVASEAAISVENTRLYDEMKQEVARRRQAEETLRAIVEGTAAVTGGDFFSALVHRLASAIGVRYAFATECTDRAKTRVRTLAFWSGDSFAENIEYDLALTPCERVIDGQVCHHVSELQARFPHDKDLVTLGAESFLGLPMADAAGEIIGHLAVLDDKPMPNASQAMSLMKIFAARAVAELQRLKAEQELRQAMAEVEQLKNRLQDENVYLQEEIRREHHFEEIVGSSPPLLELLNQLEIVAPTDSTILIHGETGTGKELIARAVHDRSARKSRPLVKVNCGAISAGLVESELFGHVKGAFTGAIERRVGRFELADGGTLFLDEVSELPLDTQVKLLRVLQEQEFEPVGSSRAVRVDVRIIAATNRPLEEAVRASRFRQDLFYRLNVFPLNVPPLRERLTDIPQLVMFFLSRFAKRFGKKIDSVSQESLQMLARYPWPGNVRELQNIIERAVVLCQGNVLVLGRNFLPTLEQSEATTALKSRAASASPMPVSPPALGNAPPPSTLEEVERCHILEVLAQTGWTIDGPNGAARLLSLHPNTLRSRMKKLGIQRPRHEIS
jgi:formate hydrogenlyase transcriptional activator